jgi:hypothetical protein
MRLARESHQQIEAFLREHFRDERLRLPPVFIYCGRLSQWLTRRFQILAITFGRRIFVAAKEIKRDEQGRLTAPAGLIAHEATHVLQYERAGFVGFLASYLWEYWRILREQRQGWSKSARHAAYFAIKQEREAYEAEQAFAVWSSLEKLSADLKNSPSAHAEEDEDPH